MLMAQHPAWTGEQIANRIRDTVTPFKEGIDTNGMGAGVLNAKQALAIADPLKYGPWQLYAGAPGQDPVIWITDEYQNELHVFMAGNPGDHRGLAHKISSP